MEILFFEIVPPLSGRGKYYGGDIMNFHTQGAVNAVDYNGHSWCLGKWTLSFVYTRAAEWNWEELLRSGPPPLHIWNFFHFFFLLLQLLPFSISLFPSANWPSQAGLGLCISGFEATSETKAKLWVWFGLGRACWPRRVVFLGQTRERWGEVFVWI